MDTKDHEYLDAFEKRMTQALVESCSADGLLDGQMLEVEELDVVVGIDADEVLGVAALTALPWIPGMSEALGLAPLPAAFWSLLVTCAVGYLLLVGLMKRLYVRRFGSLL